MKRTILVALLALLTSNIALAAKWLPITNSSDSYWFLDSSSLRSTKSTTTGWTKVEIRMKSIKMDGVKSKIIKYIADCKARKIQALTWSAYSISGEVVSSADQPSAPNEVYPESLGEILFDSMCNSHSTSRMLWPIRVGTSEFTESYFSRRETASAAK